MARRTGTFYKVYEALEPEGQSTDGVDGNPSGIKGTYRATPPTPCIMTSSVMRKRRVVVIGDPLLRGKENLICSLDPGKSVDSQGLG